MRMHLNNSECSCQLLREAEWQSVHYPLIKGSIRAQHRPHRRKSIFRPTRMHKSKMTEQRSNKPHPNLFTSCKIWTKCFGIVLKRKAPSNKIIPSGDARFSDQRAQPHILPWVLSFRELIKSSFLYELTQRKNDNRGGSGYMGSIYRTKIISQLTNNSAALTLQFKQREGVKNIYFIHTS